MRLFLFLLLAGIIFIPATPADAEEPPGNWSLDFKGGLTSGQFTIDAKRTGHGGVNLRYSMNPLLSFYGNLEVGQFRADESVRNVAGFSNDFFSAGLGMRANVLRMFTDETPLSRRLALYTTAGIGLMAMDVRVTNTDLMGYTGQSFSGSVLALRIGSGVSWRISRRIDVFLQAELNHSDSDLLDGYERHPGATRTGLIAGGDSFINTTAGITVKLGSSSVRHADWTGRSESGRGAIAASHEDELARIQAEIERSDRMKEDLARQLQSLSRTLTEFSELVSTTQQQQLDTHALQISRLEEQLQLLLDEQAELDPAADLPGTDVSESDTPPSDGRGTGVNEPDPDEAQFFVVAGAFRNQDNATRLVQQLREQGFSEAGVQYDAGRDFHVVTYSGFTTREQAEQELARIRAGINPESWIFSP
ncbi:MAG: SPOR domain-containing protein [Cyclonatronaceae bacterium]